MNRRLQLALIVVALLVAAGAGLYAYRFFDRMATTARVAVPAVSIPPYTLIRPEMLSEREVSRSLLGEPIYVRAGDLAGRVAVVPLQPGMVVYRTFAVLPAEFRLATDPALSVVSFPVDPARAVGGQVQIGHRVDVWRLVAAQPAQRDISVAMLLSQTFGAAGLLAEGIPVVDVRQQSGAGVVRQAQPDQRQAQPDGTARQPQATPLQILTVAVPPEVAQAIVGLIAEERAGAAELWVSLAPLERALTAEAEEVQATVEEPADMAAASPPPAAASPTPRPTLPVTVRPTAVPATPTTAPTPQPTPSPTPVLTATVATDGAALQVRDAPNGGLVGRLDNGAAVVVLEGPTEAGGRAWYRVQAGEVTGWSAADFLQLQPVRP